MNKFFGVSQSPVVQFFKSLFKNEPPTYDETFGAFEKARQNAKARVEFDKAKQEENLHESKRILEEAQSKVNDLNQDNANLEIGIKRGEKFAAKFDEFLD